MADQPITGLTALAVAPASTDVLVIVDVSDTTQSPQGTTKKITVANLALTTVNERLVVFTTDPGTGASTIVKSSGVTSITDNAGGDYTINFTAMPDANYGVFINGRSVPTAGFIGMEQHDIPTRTTTAVRIYTLRINNLSTLVPINPEYCSVLIKG